MSGQDITIKGKDGDFSGYLAKPPADKAPAKPMGLIVIQEIFGVNKVMRDLCDHYAEQGFTALCPDLFWRIEPGIQITDQTEEEWKKAFELFQAFDVDKGVEDIDASLDHLSGLEIEKSGAVGFCLGGLLAYLTACRTSSGASVGYYGVNIHEKLDEATKIKAPLMLHIAGKDEFVPPEAQAKIHAGLEGHALITLHDYPEDDHAFSRAGGAHYNADSAAAADGRTLDFLKANLG